MQNYKRLIFHILSYIIIFGLLFGFVSNIYAQGAQDWNGPINLSNSGEATNPILVIDANDEIHAIWVDNIDGYKYSHSMDGEIWTKPLTVNYPFDIKSPVPVLLSDDESIHVFWIDPRRGLSYVRATSSNIAEPAQWQSTTVRLAPQVANYDVIQDVQGALHIAYITKVSSETAPAGVYYRQLVAIGTAWSEEYLLNESEYFRSSTVNDSFIRVAASNELTDQRVYVSWDNRSQKSIFIAISDDSGLNWKDAQQVRNPEDTGGIGAPFNFNVATVDDNVLYMWQVGEPGTARCELLSQWSENNGKSWGKIVSVLDGRTDCPLSSKLIVQDEGNIIALLKGQVDSTLIAWDGEKWSNPQVQAQLPALANPLTLDAILLNCRFDLIKQNRLFVIGCDQGGGEDIWFLSRKLDAIKTWFAAPKTWSEPESISVNTDLISSILSVSDTEGVIHSVWAQSSVLGDGTKKVSINYSRWDGDQWTRPGPIISPLRGIPLQMSFTIDPSERLLLSWVDGDSGELLFSWANLERANLASEWVSPVGLPSPSNLIISSDILVDRSGRIVVVYVVPVNENRGIYAVQSTDTGKNWSLPIRVFDAVSVDWEKIEEPKIGLTNDGVMHVIFSRTTVRTGQPVGLYYSKSFDGGVTWEESQVVSEKEIVWSEISCYDDHTVNVIWQENDGLVFANLSQVSLDSGESWSKPFNVTAVNASSTPVALATDEQGNLRFIQLLKSSNASIMDQEKLNLQDWKWTGSRWEIASSSEFTINGTGLNYSIASDISPLGFLGVYLSARYSDSENNIQNEVLAFSRLLDGTDISNESFIAVIPTPASLANDIEPPLALPTETMDLSILESDNIVTPQQLRNIIGVIIVLIVIAISFISIRRRNNG